MKFLTRVCRPIQRHVVVLVAIFNATVVAAPCQAATYYWDANGSTSGFGTASGTWTATVSGTPGWSTSSDGSTELSAVTTTTSDQTQFGASGTPLGSGTITVSGTVSSGDQYLESNTITLGRATGSDVLSFSSGRTITVNDSAGVLAWNVRVTYPPNIFGAGAPMYKQGPGTLAFGADNSASLTVFHALHVRNGTVRVDNTSTALGGMWIRLGDPAGTNPTSIQINDALTVSNFIDVVPLTGSGTTATQSLKGGNVDVGYSGLIQARNNLTIDPNGTGQISIGGGGLKTIDAGKMVTFQSTSTGAIVNGAQWSGSGGITYRGSGSGLTTISGASAYSGATYVQTEAAAGAIVVAVNSTGTSGAFGTGPLWISNAPKFQSGTSAGVTIGNAIAFGGGTWVFPSVANEKSLTFTGNMSLGVFGTPTFQVDLGTSTAESVSFNGSITGSPGIVKRGGGRLVLGGANSYSGQTMIEAGTLQVGNGGTAGTLSGFGSIANAGTLAFNRSDTVTLSRVITGTGALVQQGTGNLILTAASTFTGPTSVSAGRLSVNGSLGNSAVTVASTAELGGSGSIDGPISVLGGGTLAPGNSIESLAVGVTSFAAGSTFGYEVDSSLLGSLGTAADLLVVNGNLDIASGALLAMTDITSGSVPPFPTDTTVFAMISYSGTWNGGLFTSNGTPLADGSQFNVGGQTWQIDYTYVYDTASPTTIRPLNFQADYLPSSGTQTFVAITAVPEPSTYCMALAGLACGYSMFRRRKRA